MLNGLDEEEREEVRNGLYDSWDFSDDPEDMEEGDYYEDDF